MDAFEIKKPEPKRVKINDVVYEIAPIDVASVIDMEKRMKENDGKGAEGDFKVLSDLLSGRGIPADVLKTIPVESLEPLIEYVMGSKKKA